MFSKIFQRKQSTVPKVESKPEEAIDLQVLAVGLEDIQKREEAAGKVLDFLGIPHTQVNCAVSGTALVDLLMDTEKAKVLFAKLRNKAFW